MNATPDKFAKWDAAYVPPFGELSGTCSLIRAHLTSADELRGPTGS